MNSEIDKSDPNYIIIIIIILFFTVVVFTAVTWTQPLLDLDLFSKPLIKINLHTYSSGCESPL